MEPPTPPPTPPSPPTLQPVRRDWWSRNWKWFIPTGCLTLFLLGCAFVATIVFTVFAGMKSSDAYKHAVARAKADQRVVEAIGTPIKEGWFVSGSTEVTGGSGKSDLTIPIRGPKASATIYAVATKFAGEWQYSKLVVKIEGTGETIDLNQATDGED